MNTKSFVNGLDPENTVKGYYDENDQLVMVEPEGSGGGGGFETAAVSITAENYATANVTYINLVSDGLIESRQDSFDSSSLEISAVINSLGYIDDSHTITNVSGDVELLPDSPHDFIVRGPGSIEVS